MRAAVYHKPYSRLSIEERLMPEPGPDEVLIKVRACGICHTDLHFIDHGVPPLKKPPLILGHEISGTVDEVGDQVEGLSVGQPVLVAVMVPCYECAYCQQGRTNLCRRKHIPGNAFDGGFAEYMTVHKNGVIPLPEEIPLEPACVIADVFGTTYHALHEVARLQPEETLLVFGTGGLGSAAIQVAKHQGASVIALDMNPLKLQWAEELGADETINASSIRDLGGYVRDLTDGGVDVALEAVGAPRTIYQAFTCLRPAGRLIILGYTRNEFKLPEPQLVVEERAVLGVRSCPMEVYPKVFEHVINGEYRLEPIVTKRLQLQDIEEGLNSVRSGQTLRTIIEP